MIKETKIYNGNSNLENNLGCGAEVNMHTTNGFICGVPNAWGTETFCQNCEMKLKIKWEKEDKKENER